MASSSANTSSPIRYGAAVFCCYELTGELVKTGKQFFRRMLSPPHYLTVMTLDVAPSVPLPLNLLLLADSAVPPLMAVPLL